MRLTEKQTEQLRQYESLLLTWNKTHNLISRKQTKNIEDHIQDSLSVCQLLGENVLDLGSGGGFPGIPIAIASPKKNIFLIERKRGRAAFLLNSTNKLGLKNTTVINKSSEDLQPDELPNPLDIITRAFGHPRKAISATKKLLETPGTCLKMMKTHPIDWAKDLPNSYLINKIENIKTKGKDKPRILVTIVHKKKCTQ